MLARPLPSSADAPHAHRTVQIAPGRHVNLVKAGHPLANFKPQTRLGRVALDLTMATSTSLISVVATTAYVYSLTGLALPVITFREPPPGTTIPVDSLKQAYQDFQTKVVTFQGQASLWIDTQPGTSTPSIFSQLVAIPRTLALINGTVQSKFTILSALQPGTDPYQQTLQQLKSLIGAESTDITTLKSGMVTLGTNLQSATTTIGDAGTTGVLKQLTDAYASELAALTTVIDNANSTISSDNEEIVGLGFAAGASIVVGLIGLANYWNPIGWVMIAAGAVGAYFSLAEIEVLKGEIATLTSTIQADKVWKTDDSQAAASIQSTIQQTAGFASMNTAAQNELTELETLLSTLGDDINTALTELDQGQQQQALAEWNAIVDAASVFANVTAYVWPSPILLSAPTTFSAAGSDVYSVQASGHSYRLPGGAQSWSDMADKSLSLVASGSLVIGIDGAPADGASVSPTPYPTDYHVKSYDAGSNTWTQISTFPAAQVATDGTSVYAINQTTSDRKVYRYSGSGTSWSALPAMPDSDAARDIAAANGLLLAIANNSGKAYAYRGEKWANLDARTYAAMSANGKKVGLVTTDNNSYLLDTSSSQLVHSGSSVAQLAQVSNGDQYIISTTRNLCFINNQVNPPSSTQLKANVVGIAVSNTDAVYYADNEGKSWKLNDLGSNSWTQLPAFPPAGS